MIVSGAPIRLSEAARPAVLDHLLALSGEDRYARFASTLTDMGIAAYVGRIDMVRDLCFGRILVGGTLAGFIHLAMQGTVAELGASVLPLWRQQGCARSLFATALDAAAANGVKEVHLATGHPAARHICAGLGYRMLHGQSYPRVRVCLPPIPPLSQPTGMDAALGKTAIASGERFANLGYFSG